VDAVLVDSNVLLDIATEDPVWLAWSSERLAEQAELRPLVINPLIYSEVSVGFSRVEELDAALPAETFRREPLPWQAGFLAGKAFLEYRRSGGQKRAPLPDFYIGVHAAIQGYGLLTRDGKRFRSYFPRLGLIAP
jgi:hypothetical protein